VGKINSKTKEVKKSNIKFCNKTKRQKINFEKLKLSNNVY